MIVDRPTPPATPADPAPGYVTREELEAWFALPPAVVNHFRACECLPTKFDERTKRHVFDYAAAVKFLCAIGAIEAPTPEPAPTTTTESEGAK